MWQSRHFQPYMETASDTTKKPCSLVVRAKLKSFLDFASDHGFIHAPSANSVIKPKLVLIDSLVIVINITTILDSRNMFVCANVLLP